MIDRLTDGSIVIDCLADDSIVIDRSAAAASERFFISFKIRSMDRTVREAINDQAIKRTITDGKNSKLSWNDELKKRRIK